MKKFLVITTINYPTEAVKKFASLSSWQIVVVGDKKTPGDWLCENVVYLSCEEQSKYGLDLPWNNYVRKMIGYLYAIENGASIIAETDDDNIPYKNWDSPAYSDIPFLVSNVGFVNVYSKYTEQHIWPRGLPFHAIKTFCECKDGHGKIKIGIWQGLANEDPDVDAIYRLTDGSFCIFEEKGPTVLEKGVVSPFNSQNTFFRKEMFPLLYLPVTVNQRFADILRGYVAQPIMWAADYLLGFTSATVIQKRNAHDLMSDFIDEIPCYTLSEKAFQIVDASVKKENSIIENMKIAYEALHLDGIVDEEEASYLNQWLTCLG